eukprot:gene1698-biopygen1812
MLQQSTLETPETLAAMTAVAAATTTAAATPAAAAARQRQRRRRRGPAPPFAPSGFGPRGAAEPHDAPPPPNVDAAPQRRREVPDEGVVSSVRPLAEGGGPRPEADGERVGGRQAARRRDLEVRVPRVRHAVRGVALRLVEHLRRLRAPLAEHRLPVPPHRSDLRVADDRARGFFWNLRKSPRRSFDRGGSRNSQEFP